MKDVLTPRQIRERLDYDQVSGLFTWRINQKRARKGNIAGCLRPDRYISIRMDGRLYLAHRLAWAWVHGVWPNEIDHIDMDPSNNRISNLRVATRSQNKGNVRANANNTSGYKGVTYVKREKDRASPWKACIKVNGKTINLGCFKTPEAAHAAYVAAAVKFFGKFARAA